jgi:hypothetical protein
VLWGRSWVVVLYVMRPRHDERPWRKVPIVSNQDNERAMPDSVSYRLLGDYADLYARWCAEYWDEPRVAQADMTWPVACRFSTVLRLHGMVRTRP